MLMDYRRWIILLSVVFNMSAVLGLLRFIYLPSDNNVGKNLKIAKKQITSNNAKQKSFLPILDMGNKKTFKHKPAPHTEEIESKEDMRRFYKSLDTIGKVID